MDIIIAVPEDVGRQLEAVWVDLPRRALEALAIDAYRSGMIAEPEVQRMFHLPSCWQVDAFLKRRETYLDSTEVDLEQGILAMRQVLPQ
jgi:hypothetical protein